MQSVLGSFDNEKYKKMLGKLKDEQRIIQLEELIDSERMKRKELEQEAKLIMTQIQTTRNKRITCEKFRGTSLPKYYPDDSPFKERAIIRNTLMSTAFKEY
jgi:hypothetical protein